MIIDCISDLHGHYPELEGGDLLIVAGDLTAHESMRGLILFNTWILKQKYKKKIVIAGNHDNILQTALMPENLFFDCTYLCDSGTEFEIEEDIEEDHWTGKTINYKRKRIFKIWGSPWSKTFPVMNPNCKAFTVDTDEELAEKWALIPDDIDILVTHSPPYGILDAIPLQDGSQFHVGSRSLRDTVIKRIKPRLHIYGHIHEWGGKSINLETSTFVNASYVNESYEPVNKPVRIIL